MNDDDDDRLDPPHTSDDPSGGANDDAMIDQGSIEDDAPADDSFEQDESDFGEFSLDDIGAAYARAAAAHDPETFAAPEPAADDEPDDDSLAESSMEEPLEEDDEAVHPEGIIEAALFVGHPENQAFTAARLASLMRGVTEEEVVEMIDSLNQSYKSAEQALRIIEDEGGGYRMTIAPAVEKVRHSFLGRVREARLSQAAVEVLSLVAYQPGVTAQTVQDQRGKDSGSLLNQLVRRRLLEMRRQQPADGGRKVPHYYPTERFLTLFGLESLEDLPLVDESFFGQ
ncbi:Segregation and condensation protein B [Stieleria maiorica]|uniref:Segregation and condensation protein B n=1 Tax=Stieleria maiorica TaxID=2795974 RepID=A0A5B9MGT1_9BACT|nr:SMC-Scp complex subunit ScpB [Stieleria maiorica]QEF99326.1 Segregation and condensation protein B [Stieleria maiorica]